MKELDVEKWYRREQYEFFSGISHPFYSVTFRVDVSGAYAFAKKNGVSFYHVLTYLVTEAVNSVDELKLTVRGGVLICLDRRRASFTALRKGSDSFFIVTMPDCGDLTEFCREAERRSLEQRTFIDTAAESDELIFISCLPWLDLTSLTNERDFDRNDAIPRITWGKYCDADGRKTLGMSVEVNHRFCDGVHIGKFYTKLQSLIDALDTEKNIM